MIPKEAHLKYRLWLVTSANKPRNSDFLKEKMMQLNDIAFVFSSSRNQYKELFKELCEYYNASTEGLDVKDYYNTALGIMTEGVREEMAINYTGGLRIIIPVFVIMIIALLTLFYSVIKIIIWIKY
jgi:hypothetical protein